MRGHRSAASCLRLRCYRRCFTYSPRNSHALSSALSDVVGANGAKRSREETKSGERGCEAAWRVQVRSVAGICVQSVECRVRDENLSATRFCSAALGLSIRCGEIRIRRSAAAAAVEEEQWCGALGHDTCYKRVTHAATTTGTCLDDGRASAAATARTGQGRSKLRTDRIKISNPHGTQTTQQHTQRTRDESHPADRDKIILGCDSCAVS